MKRWLVSVIALVYLILTTGFTVHMHYCMDELIGTTLWHDQDEQHDCESCGMKRSSNSDCCKDVHKVVKADDEHSVFPIADLTFYSFADLPLKNYFRHLGQRPYPATIPTMAMANAPPGKRIPACPLFLAIQNIRV